MPVHNWAPVYAGLFHDFHQSWSIRIKDAMNAGMLPTGMSALVEQKMGPKESDVLTVDALDQRSSHEPRGGVMTAEAPSTRIVRKSTKEFYAKRANRIVVKYRLGRTVAVIEIVSPGNKDSKRAFKEFLDKSLKFLNAGIHLLVIDLFPPTKRDPLGVHQAIWENFDDEDPFEFPPGKDRILASYEAGDETSAYVEPIAVGDKLPDMALFLFDHHHVKVPLEATYQTTWSVLPRDLQVIVETGVMPPVPNA